MPWRILVVDDEVHIAEQVAELLRESAAHTDGSPAIVDVSTEFESALARLEEYRFDLLVLDVRQEAAAEQPADDAAGLAIFEAVRQRRFIPIVFYTALPGQVEGQHRPPFVSVVSKIDANPIDELRSAVTAVLESSLPRVNRALTRHVEQVIREFMADFVEQHWSQLEAPVRRGDLAHLLVRRLAMSLAAGAQALAGELEGVDEGLDGETVHPMRFYVMPPDGDYLTGDLLCESISNGGAVGADPGTGGAGDPELATSEHWFVVLTPACDLVTGRVKADFVVVAQCVPLESLDEFTKWRDALGKAGADDDAEAAKKVEQTEKKLSLLITNRPDGRQADRYYFLPAAWEVPDLVVDLQRIVNMPYEALSHYRRVATLDSPYSEALSNQYARFMSRVGVPDLNVDVVLDRIRPGSEDAVDGPTEK